MVSTLPSLVPASMWEWEWPLNSQEHHPSLLPLSPSESFSHKLTLALSPCHPQLCSNVPPLRGLQSCKWLPLSFLLPLPQKSLKRSDN